MPWRASSSVIPDEIRLRRGRTCQELCVVYAPVARSLDLLVCRCARSEHYSGTRKGQVGDGAPECRFGSEAVFDTPVLAVGSAILSDVKPHEPQGAVMTHPGEKAGNLRCLT